MSRVLTCPTLPRTSLSVSAYLRGVQVGLRGRPGWSALRRSFEQNMRKAIACPRHPSASACSPAGPGPSSSLKARTTGPGMGSGTAPSPHSPGAGPAGSPSCPSASCAGGLAVPPRPAGPVPGRAQSGPRGPSPSPHLPSVRFMGVRPGPHRGRLLCQGAAGPAGHSPRGPRRVGHWEHGTLWRGSCSSSCACRESSLSKTWCPAG